ncbi:MAG: PQQ-like beta-propeller repeat protein [Planctomycetia bacterium]|nr:PQQ-like beta-propeller repeat protein [Planctomycetia bacterium]
MAAAVAFFATFRIDSVSGELFPSFVFRWSHKPDQLLPAAEIGHGDAERPPVDLRTTTVYDFPQFLGKGRNLLVDNVILARDWAGQPPKLVWRHAIGAGWSSFAVVNGHAVTMEQRGGQELVTCYSIRNGELEWVNSIQARYELITGGVGPRSTPTIDDGLVYSLGATGRLQCLEGATGNRRWERNLREDCHITVANEASDLPWGRSASPLVVDDLVIVPGGGPSGGPFVSLVAMDKKTGKTVWEGGDRQISYSSPAVATLGGVRQVLIVNEADVTGLDLKTGKVLWEHPWPGSSNSSASVSQAVPVAPDRVLLSKAYGNGAAFLKLVPSGEGAFEAEVVWANSKVMKTKFSNVAIKDGFVYGLSDGVLECVDLADGRRAWREGRYPQGQILRVGDLLLVLAESGEVVLVEASPDRANHVLGRFQAIEGQTWNNFALYGPYLLVRNALESACYELPLEEPARL